MDVINVRISGCWKMASPVSLIFTIWICILLCGAYAQTYTLSDGDVVNCIPIESQPSLQNLTNPTYNKSPTATIGSTAQFPDNALIANQTFVLEVGACPDGTIPVRQEPLRRLKTGKPLQDLAAADKDSHHEYAIALTDPSSSIQFKGTEVIINIWDPLVETPEDFSLAQLWITRGSDENLNTVEAGYQVYGNGNYSRLFVYWTADNYNNTGCYDLECSGFIQVSSKVLIRGSFTYTSAEEGQLYEIKLQVFQDSDTSDWWLLLNDEVVGYWPNNIFSVGGLKDSAADSINWGGEIVDNDTESGNRHTTTDMGSGEPAGDGYGQAAYMRNLQYIDSDYNLLDYSPLYLLNTSAPCYSVSTTESSDTVGWGSFFYFGGPGYNAQCQTDPS